MYNNIGLFFNDNISEEVKRVIEAGSEVTDDGNFRLWWELVFDEALGDIFVLDVM
jgi:hypothetical protein